MTIATRTGTMRAIVARRYGDPAQILESAEAPRPSIDPDQVLVRVQATPVSGTDWHLFRGLPYVSRPIVGLRRPRNPIPGLDLAGTVVAVGSEVSTLTTGDEVFGWGEGTYAEYAAVPAAQLVLKPAPLSLTEAGAVPIGAFTALQAVRDKGEVGPGQRVLISGASGGVGTYAVQIAKSLGAEVTGVASTAKLDLVRSIGADHVLDYTEGDFTRSGERFDVFIDLYGNPSLAGCRRMLVDGGTVVHVGGTGGKWFMGVDRWARHLLASPFLDIRVRCLIHKDRREDLLAIKDLIERGEIRPVVDRTYPLSEAALAIEHARQGRIRGQAVLAP